MTPPALIDGLLLVFVHGYVAPLTPGNEATFEQYPDRLKHLVLETYPALHVVSVVYPTYETRGSLQDAIDALVSWLTVQVAEIESQTKKRFAVVLCGHSMGGIVCLDSALAIRESASHGRTPWPPICGVLAYDTPYLGIHPHVFKHQLTSAQSYMDSAMKLGSVLAPVTGGLATLWNARQSHASGTGKMSTAAWIGVGAAAAAALGTAATAVMTRSDPLQDAYRWISEHVMFVKHLWDGEALASRMSGCDVPFHCFYTTLAGQDERPFILPPPSNASYAKYFSPLVSHAKEEVTAHMSMFSLTTNSSYLKMGIESAALLAEWIPHEGGQRAEFDGDVPISGPLD